MRPSIYRRAIRGARFARWETAKPRPSKYTGSYRRTGEERAQYIADKRLTREEYIAELSRRDREGFKR